jgi:hypothetical protein
MTLARWTSSVADMVASPRRVLALESADAGP